MRECQMAPPRFDGAPLGLKFRLIHERFKSMTNEEMQQYDLTYSQMWVLWYLNEHKGEHVRQKDLCDAAHVKHPTMVGLLRRMEAKELVAMVADPEDRRQSLVSITDKARETMERQRTERDARDGMLVDGMSTEDVRRLNELLEIVYNNIEKAQKGNIEQ